MIRIVTTLVLVLASLLLPAQTKLEKGMQKAFQLMKENKNDQAANVLERIANAETENWLPAYHLGLLKARTSFQMKDKAKQAAQIKAAEEYAATADALSPNNSEVYVLKAFVNLAKIVADPMTNGMKLSAPTETLYKKAIELDNTNPRAHSGLVEFQMGSARYFGQDLKPYCERLQKTIKLYDAFKPKSKLHPNWGKEWVLGVIKSCGSNEKTTNKTSGTTITVKVPKVVRKGGEIIFALFDSEENFNNKKPVAVKKAAVSSNSVEVVFDNVKAGEYAIVAVHDMNGNERMDFNTSGMPMEDYGTSNNNMSMGPPSFGTAKFSVTNKSVNLEIKF